MSSENFRCGNILKFRTYQARNFERSGRNKYHLYLGLAHDHSGRHVFMFINSEGREGCMRIDRDDWPDMPNEESFISSTALFHYSQTELADAELFGRLTDDALLKLMDHAEASETLAGTDIDVVVDALMGHFEG